ncbi:Collagenase [Eumeta japonica]|uniref:Collagenase n=1 Tax=Eumeta variegata TaxID=151549 RepID=A0A4C1VV69_EUMVA|nr:Collagenase [Eumeta japonica]
MKVLLGILLLCAAALAEEPEQLNVVIEETTAFDYHNKIGIADAARIKQQEEASEASRIVGVSAAGLGVYPYQAGLVITLTTGATSVCGASLLTNTRLSTAAHCWWDGRGQAPSVRGRAWLDPLVLWRYSHHHHLYNIRNIALPTNALNQNFAGQWAWASGFGRTSDLRKDLSESLFAAAGIGNNQFLSHVRLQVITNAVCQQTYGNTIIASTICTSGAGWCRSASPPSGLLAAARSVFLRPSHVSHLTLPGFSLASKLCKFKRKISEK